MVNLLENEIIWNNLYLKRSSLTIYSQTQNVEMNLHFEVKQVLSSLMWKINMRFRCRLFSFSQSFGRVRETEKRNTHHAEHNNDKTVCLQKRTLFGKRLYYVFYFTFWQFQFFCLAKGTLFFSHLKWCSFLSKFDVNKCVFPWLMNKGCLIPSAKKNETSFILWSWWWKRTV